MSGLGARGRLRDAPGRVWNGLGASSWAALAAKLAVLATKLAVRGAKLAVSSVMLALLSSFRGLVERVASRNPSPSSVRSEFLLDVGTIARSPKLEICASTQCFVNFSPKSRLCVLDAFWVQKNFPKTLPKRGPNDEKIDAENVLIFNIDFLRFRPRFGSLLGLPYGAKLAILA